MFTPVIKAECGLSRDRFEHCVICSVPATVLSTVLSVLFPDWPFLLIGPFWYEHAVVLQCSFQ